MTTRNNNDGYNHDTPCDESAPVGSALLATALFLGYFVGRVSLANPVREALRWIEESPEPIAVSIGVL